MQLEIDGTPITYTLEQEKTVDDVLSSLSQWLSQYQMIAETLHIDENPYEKDTHGHLSVGNVQKIQVATQHRAELQVKKLVFLSETINALEEDAEHGGKEVGKALQSEKESIVDIVRSCFTEQESKLFSHALFTSPLVPVLRTLQEIIQGRIQELLHPNDASQRTGQKLRGTLQAMIDIPLLLQTGKTHDAMQLLSTFTQELQTMLRVNPPPKDNQLYGLLKELQDQLATEDIDTVLLGDLIEYDVVPQCTEWLDSLSA